MSGQNSSTLATNPILRNDCGAVYRTAAKAGVTWKLPSEQRPLGKSNRSETITGAHPRSLAFTEVAEIANRLMIAIMNQRA